MPNGELTLKWADGSRTFNIAKLGHVLELEEKCGAGVSEILMRLRSEKWFVRDIREVIRLSIIGGGSTPAEALVLTERYVDGRPWRENLPVATAILFAAMVGIPGDPLGKNAAGQTTTETTVNSPLDSSAPPSTDSALPSDLPPDK